MIILSIYFKRGKISLPLTPPVSYFHITIAKDQLPVNISGTALLDLEHWTSRRISLCSTHTWSVWVPFTWKDTKCPYKCLIMCMQYSVSHAISCVRLSLYPCLPTAPPPRTSELSSYFINTVKESFVFGELIIWNHTLFVDEFEILCVYHCVEHYQDITKY